MSPARSANDLEETPTCSTSADYFRRVTLSRFQTLLTFAFHAEDEIHSRIPLEPDRPNSSRLRGELAAAPTLLTLRGSSKHHYLASFASFCGVLSSVVKLYDARDTGQGIPAAVRPQSLAEMPTPT